MAQLEYFLIAESVSIDRRTNRVSIFNVFDDVSPSEFPYIIPEMVAIIGWNLPAEERETDFQVRLEVTTPGEDVKEFTLNFRGESRRHRTTLWLRGLELTEPGEVVFQVSLNGHREASHKIGVSNPDCPNDPIAP